MQTWDVPASEKCIPRLIPEDRMDKTVYFDNAASTPLCLESKQIMIGVMENSCANPSGAHGPGIKAKRIVSIARAEIASALDCYEKEIIFTSGGTESDNMAIIGAALANSEKGRHIVTTSFEHHAVLNSCKALGKMGFGVTYVSPDSRGFVAKESIEKAIRPDTILVSVMHANNEIGTIQPIYDIADLVKEKGILFHTDAVCTFGKLKISMKELKADFLSAGSHKINGPKGTGFLFARRGAGILPLINGGSQEYGLRAGTENVPGIAGFGAAVAARKGKEALNIEKVGRLRDLLLEGIMDEIPDVRVNGSLENRMAGNLNVAFKGVVGTSLLILLDGKGICASTGASCNQAKQEPSHVLKAIGLSDEEAASSIRFSLSEYNTEEEVRYVIDALKDGVSYLRNLVS